VTEEARSGSVDPDSLLATAFGLVDGYVEAARGELFDAAYEFSSDQLRGRHPDEPSAI
jgi:hypothetical protein